MDTHKQAQKIVDAYLKEINLQVGDKIWTENLVDVCARGIEQARAAALEEAAQVADGFTDKIDMQFAIAPQKIAREIAAQIHALKG